MESIMQLRPVGVRNQLAYYKEEKILFIIQINNSLNTLVVNRHKENEEIKRVIGLMIIGVISNIGGIHAEHQIYVGNFQTSFMTENDQ